MSSDTGSSTILNQQLAGSIMVRHMKSISDPSLPLRVYGPTKPTHKYSLGLSITYFVGSFPYLRFLSLLTLQDLQVLTYDWTSFLRFG